MARRQRYLSLETPAGKLTIVGDQYVIRRVFFGFDSKLNHCDEVVEKDYGVLTRAKREIMEYFVGNRKVFTVPLKVEGTDFQRRAWGALRQIPYGVTYSYADQARNMGQPKAARAVGGANRQNPIVIIIPCHRVIGSNGSLTGYAGGVLVKQYLLKLESHHAEL